MRPLLDIRVARGGLFGGGGGGSAAPAPAPVYPVPVAPGTLQQTIISGNPNPNAALPPPVGETAEERRRRLELQNSILGGGSGGADAGGDGSGAASGGAGQGADAGTAGGGDGGSAAP